ncbi:hypothetical protein M433DRAFT_230919 [Acidomyces richmondensis BFW]|nr:MAG: hypothetical protein FE78DRAFT_388487 [Acidomyces sp. 'richmondensis']KYG49863.1 hypothetical protein M433DRAFT_230919 [Acidomyces richmondensis BFW]
MTPVSCFLPVTLMSSAMIAPWAGLCILCFVYQQICGGPCILCFACQRDIARHSKLHPPSCLHMSLSLWRLPRCWRASERDKCLRYAMCNTRVSHPDHYRWACILLRALMVV